GDVVRDRLDLDPHPRARDAPLRFELIDDGLDGICGHVEAYSNGATRWRKDRGANADHVAIHVECRPARISLVDGGVDLNVVVVRPRADVAAVGRDDPGRHRSSETKGIADRQNPFTDARHAIGELDVWKIFLPVDLDEGDVRLWVSANNPRRIFGS